MYKQLSTTNHLMTEQRNWMKFYLETQTHTSESVFTTIINGKIITGSKQAL